jgi:hypothetical protein
MPTETLKNIVKQAEAWSEEDQEELASYARVIEARRSGLYRVSDAERTALGGAIAEAERGAFATEAEVAAADKRRGV